jgi:riboflavin synthase
MTKHKIHFQQRFFYFADMFTGIIETMGTIEAIEASGSNKSFWVSSDLAVEEVKNRQYRVTAVEETLQKTTLQFLKPGHLFNLERCLELPARLDGHIVQGHIDTTATCLEIEEKEGSWVYTFQFAPKFAPLIVEKGSIALNGISLTVFEISNIPTYGILKKKAL